MIPILPPFEGALAKVQGAENGWNTRDPVCVALACTEASDGRNRSESLRGRAAVWPFLAGRQQKELLERTRAAAEAAR